VSLAVYATVYLHPQVVFAYETRAGNVTLHRRSPLPARAGEIAEAARQRVSRSPMYVPGEAYDVFLCDSPWLFDVFALHNYRAGGIADVYIARNVFLRPTRIERDRLIGPSGAEAAGDRTLTYFIAHEIAHIMVARRIGRQAYYRLQPWQREGYADYVGKGGSFDFAATLRDFKANARALDPHKSGLYLRYHLLVAELLDHRGMTPEVLLSRPMDAAPIERALSTEAR
jgi:hypothetical protein